MGRLQTPANVSSVTDHYKAERFHDQRKHSMGAPRRHQHTSLRSMTLHNHREVPPRDKLRGRRAGKEVARRALMPPIRKLNMRWRNFQPTPSRLSNMSMT
ncbi:hypothetical protein DCAR_0418013 [Daucus carota subsp. sativus]|uniref:Uncharacterized protein n=1 Tax=Daucus carota subsp. sativus TaxID=79200 RepID=A0AAF1AXS6_DAUCS|nr:hypothetical protein DCAR_0418013 [Daucus carota subsp. sativus]